MRIAVRKGRIKLMGILILGSRRSKLGKVLLLGSIRYPDPLLNLPMILTRNPTTLSWSRSTISAALLVSAGMKRDSTKGRDSQSINLNPLQGREHITPYRIPAISWRKG